MAALNVKITWDVTNSDGTPHHKHTFDYTGVSYETMVNMQKMGVAALGQMTDKLPAKSSS